MAAIQHVFSGAGAPATAPGSLSAHYTNTTNGDQYYAKGTDSAADWVLQEKGGAAAAAVQAHNEALDPHPQYAAAAAPAAAATAAIDAHKLEADPHTQYVQKVGGKQLSTEDYTTGEKSKLAGLESSHFKGLFATIGALTAAVASPVAGDYADVDAGVGSDVVRHLWDASDAAWKPQTGGAGMTAAQIKTEYESNPDTNAYTDAEKTKLAGLSAEGGGGGGALTKTNFLQHIFWGHFGTSGDLYFNNPEVGSVLAANLKVTKYGQRAATLPMAAGADSGYSLGNGVVQADLEGLGTGGSVVVDATNTAFKLGSTTGDWGGFDIGYISASLGGRKEWLDQTKAAVTFDAAAEFFASFKAWFTSPDDVSHEVYFGAYGAAFSLIVDKTKDATYKLIFSYKNTGGTYTDHITTYAPPNALTAYTLKLVPSATPGEVDVTITAGAGPTTIAFTTTNFSMNGRTDLHGRMIAGAYYERLTSNANAAESRICDVYAHTKLL